MIEEKHKKHDEFTNNCTFILKYKTKWRVYSHTKSSLPF